RARRHPARPRARSRRRRPLGHRDHAHPGDDRGRRNTRGEAGSRAERRGPMKRWTVTALLAGLVLASPSFAKPKPKPKKPSQDSTPIASPVATVVRAHDGWRADLAFDGQLLGWAVPRGANGKRTLFVLIGAWRRS